MARSPAPQTGRIHLSRPTTHDKDFPCKRVADHTHPHGPDDDYEFCIVNWTENGVRSDRSRLRPVEGAHTVEHGAYELYDGYTGGHTRQESDQHRREAINERQELDFALARRARYVIPNSVVRRGVFTSVAALARKLCLYIRPTRRTPNLSSGSCQTTLGISH